jgi:transcriptional regulator of acetoin/glycerol metabolism
MGPIIRSFARNRLRAGLLILEIAVTLAIVGHDWPGNVRELHNRVQRACLVAGRDVIEVADLDLGRAWQSVDSADGAGARSSGDPESTQEKARVVAVLRECDGVVSRAAKRLGVSRQALYRTMDRLGVAIERRLGPHDADP